VRALVAATVAATPLVAAPGAAAQVPPATVPPGTVPPATVPAAPAVGVEATAQKAMGSVTVGKKHGLGWVVEDGVVVTSDVVAPGAGESAVFSRIDSTRKSRCYVARTIPASHLSVLRCSDLTGADLDIAKAYPAPGQPVQLLFLQSKKATTISVRATGVVANDVEFMSHKRPQFAVVVRGTSKLQTADMLDREITYGSPLIDAEGNVVSTLLAAPEEGGAPIGTTPRELNDAVDGAADLPATFGAAAVISVAKKSFIPVIAGAVIGIVWAAVTRKGNLLGKVLGLAAVGLFLTIGWAVFGVLTTGPETLLS